ncbi:MAG: putative methylase [Thermoplasmata archaeon]|jgi:adenine-specific DNA methylase|nr:putative methylase [Thermoplasmata archaeon]
MTIPRECKRLAEVDFPIATVSRHAAREKSIRHGHPSTLHLWWARRPLASSRAVLMALLLPDPCDPACPTDFKEKARAALPRTLTGIGPKDVDLREALLKFIGDFADWNNSAKNAYLKAARTLVRAAHGDEAPLVVDPFSGGGSIPLEALRLGCDTFASDLNPVACIILKNLLENIPRAGPELAHELRNVAQSIRSTADKRLEDFYPIDPDGSRPIAYLWARTVRCESPNCGAEIPLIRSMWLCKKASRRRALRFVESAKPGAERQLEIFEPKKEGDVAKGTVAGGKATCPSCGVTLGVERVRPQLRDQAGGAEVRFDPQDRRIGGARFLAVVCLTPSATGRQYRLASERDYQAVKLAQAAAAKLRSTFIVPGIPTLPNEPVVQAKMAKNSPFRFHLYGIDDFGKLYTSRQKLTLATLGEVVRESGAEPNVKELLALVLDRVASRSSSLCSWRYQADQEKVEHMFVRQALSLEWDFAEAVPISDSTGSFSDGVEVVAQCVEQLATWCDRPGRVEQEDATASPLPDASASVWFSDPPYYDAVPYSDLSDVFYIWLKRDLPGHPLLRDRDDASNVLTPKRREARMDEAREVDGTPKDGVFFEKTMAKAFSEGRRVLREDGVGGVVFAHKTTEGWEALLSGMVKNGWVITGSWPIATEMATRLRARESAALATSIHLICRPREEAATEGDWANVARELPIKVRAWMDRLDNEGVRGADLVFACIGPAMEVYSRYSKVVDAEDREIPLGGDPTASEPYKQGYLAKVWEVVGRLALEQVLGKTGGAGTALEEDARLTALFLWALQGTASEDGNSGGGPDAEEAAEEADDGEEGSGKSAKKKGFSLPYDVVRRFAQPLGIHLETWEGRISETDKGVVRLLPVSERMKQLFGTGGAEAAVGELESSNLRGGVQLTLFPDEPPPSGAPAKKKGAKKAKATVGDDAAGDRSKQVTTLDRVHAAMLLQQSGQTAALRSLLADEKRRGPDFERLANALAALYPKGTDERRLVEAMLLAMPR